MSATSDWRLIPDADPEDVPAWLNALRAGRMVDGSPPVDARPRPVSALAAAVLAKHRVPYVPTADMR